MKMSRQHTRGFGLVETILVLVASSLLMAGVFVYYRSVSAQTRAHQTSQQAMQISDAILRGYVASSDFTGLNTQRLISDNLIPGETEVIDNNTLGTPFGGTLAVAAATVNGAPNTGFSLTYTGVPRNMCVPFVSQSISYGFKSILVNNVNVLNAQGVLNESQLASQCKAGGSNSTLVLTIDRAEATGGSFTSSCVLPSPPNETQSLACPAGYVGGITRTRTATCVAGESTPRWTDWSETNNCVPACVVDPASPQTRTSTPCPSGQLGTITERRISTCPAPSGSPVWGAWQVVSNTCAPQCMAPADEVDTSQPCPSGQIGTITRRRSAFCPQPTGAYQWNDWQVISNTCAQLCVLPTPSTQTETLEEPENRTLACPSGYYGPNPGIDEYRIHSKRRTRTASCPAQTGTPVWSSWSSWTTTNISDWTSTANRCSACPGATTSNEVQWVSASAACPSGQVGSNTWEKEQRRTVTKSYNCPAGNTPVLPPASYSYGDWTDTGAIRNQNNTCKPACTLPSPSTQVETRESPELRQFVCPAGTFGPNPGIDEWRTNYQTRSRTASCPAGASAPVWTDWTAWVTTSSSGWNRTAYHCNNCQPNTTQTETQWVGASRPCLEGQTGYHTWEKEQTRSRSVTYNCPAGATPTHPAPTYGSWTSWADTGKTRSNKNTCRCPPKEPMCIM